MLSTLKYLMKYAEKRSIAIGAFNVAHLESVRAAIAAAEELSLPIILQFAQGHASMTPIEMIAPIMLKAAREASVPVCVHLDHGEDFEYIQKALNLGFTSVMFDGSHLPYEENIRQTAQVVEMACITGASVEAELGSMGKREASGIGMEENDDDDAPKIYTDPLQAGKFIMDTGIDALACSFGTTHGLYKDAPQLNFDIVRKVRQLTRQVSASKTEDIPIVMHGGSGVSDADYREAILAGVRKINYFTYMDKAAGESIREHVLSMSRDTTSFFSPIADIAIKAMKEDIKRAMSVFALM